MISSQELRSSIYMAALQGKLTTSLRNENTDNYISTFVGKEEFEIPPIMNMIEGYYDDAAKLLKNSSVILIFGDHSKTLKYVDFDFIVGADGTKLIVPIFINPMFLYYALQYNLINLPDRGYARHFGLLRKTQIPVPPIEEQQRIVEYLDRLLPLCDELI